MYRQRLATRHRGGRGPHPDLNLGAIADMRRMPRSNHERGDGGRGYRQVMAKHLRPAGNCPQCHQHDVRYVVTSSDGRTIMACGACVDRYDWADGAAVEALA